MRAREFIHEDASIGATVAGAMAPAAQAMAPMITRSVSTKTAKYRNSAPIMKRKQNARG
jgi:hypothetical protein